MRLDFDLNYCGVCGKKIKDIVIPNSKEKVRYCKKCGYYLPDKARKYVCYEKKDKSDSEEAKDGD